MSDVLTAFVTWVQSVFDRRQRHTERIENQRASARVKFRAAVLAALEDLYPEAPKWPGPKIDPILRARYGALQKAVAEFEPSLPPELRDQFNRAWVGYYCTLKRQGEQDYQQYQTFGSATWDRARPSWAEKPRQDGQANFKTNVAALLAFANDPAP
jgi:hypothetical protein